MIHPLPLSTCEDWRSTLVREYDDDGDETSDDSARFAEITGLDISKLFDGDKEGEEGEEPTEEEEGPDPSPPDGDDFIDIDAPDDVDAEFAKDAKGHEHAPKGSRAGGQFVGKSKSVEATFGEIPTEGDKKSETVEGGIGGRDELAIREVLRRI